MKTLIKKTLLIIALSNSTQTFSQTLTVYDNEDLPDCIKIPYPPITPAIMNAIRANSLKEYDNTYQLIFEDNFDNNSLDLNKWHYVTKNSLDMHGKKLMDFHNYKVFDQLGFINYYNDDTEESNGTSKLKYRHSGVYGNLLDGEYFIKTNAQSRSSLDSSANGSYLTNNEWDAVKAGNIPLNDGVNNYRYFPFTVGGISTKQLFSKVKIEAR